MNNFSDSDRTGWYPFFVDTIAPSIRDGSVLLIGCGSAENQYLDWPENLSLMGATSVEYLEAWKEYVDRWGGGPYPVHYGNAAEAVKSVGRKSYDTVIFNQGIEHVSLDDVAAVSEELLDVGRKCVAMSCPYGSYYDYQEDHGGNPFERHVIKSPDPAMFAMLTSNGWDIKTFGAKNSGDAVIWMWRMIEQS